MMGAEAKNAVCTAVVLAAGNFVVKNYFAVCRGVDVMAWIEGL